MKKMTKHPLEQHKFAILKKKAQNEVVVILGLFLVSEIL